jgi:hypothetical protein
LEAFEICAAQAFQDIVPALAIDLDDDILVWKEGREFVLQSDGEGMKVSAVVGVSFHE